MNVDRARREISAIITDMEAIPAELRVAATDPEDGECYEIIRRLVRRFQGLPTAEPEEPAA